MTTYINKKNSIYYTSKDIRKVRNLKTNNYNYNTEIVKTNLNVVECILKYINDNTTVVNFSSNLEPSITWLEYFKSEGLYIDLYNEIYNEIKCSEFYDRHKHINYKLYKNDLIYTYSLPVYENLDNFKEFNIITINDIIDIDDIKSKLETILDISILNETKTLILSNTKQDDFTNTTLNILHDIISCDRYINKIDKIYFSVNIYNTNGC